MTEFVYNDGGREIAGFKGMANDCVCRSIAIVTRKPYREIYNLINEIAKSERIGKRKRTKSSARSGVYSATHRKVMKHLGFEWVPTMKIGTGCKVHLHPNELPKGRLVISVSKHVTAMINGVVHDTYNPCRPIQVTYRNETLAPNQWTWDGMLFTETRCVYGYYIKL